jgi:hypothetical protein
VDKSKHLPPSNYCFYRDGQIPCPSANIGELYQGIFQQAGNPVPDTIKLNATVTKMENLDIQVINAAGQVLVALHQILLTGENLVKVAVHTLAPGIYCIKLNTGNSAPETFRVLKQ